MNIILRNSVPQSVDEENHTVRIRFTDESVDSYGTSLKFDGWDFKRFMDNPTVQLDHYSDAASNIGRVLEIIPVPDERAYDAIVQFDVDDMSEYGGNWAWGKVSRGFLRTWSVGFENLVNEGLEYLKNQLFEISLVGIPSNTGATTRALNDGSISEEEARGLMKRYYSEARKLEAALDNTTAKPKGVRMNKEELQAVIAEAMKPLQEQLAALQEKLATEIAPKAEAKTEENTPAEAEQKAPAEATEDKAATEDASTEVDETETISDEEAERIIAEFEKELAEDEGDESLGY